MTRSEDTYEKTPPVGRRQPMTSSDPAASALLGCTQEEQEMSESEDVETELSQDSCPAYEELLDVMERATAKA